MFANTLQMLSSGALMGLKRSSHWRLRERLSRIRRISGSHLFPQRYSVCACGIFYTIPESAVTRFNGAMHDI